ncbi:hypothetical protein, partial [Stenotrophomonas sp. FR012]|uniref:hypothetical protein n=1 Tax=Stenotrophomonas sp. FR012 TaxID=3398457 RepID=UPI0039C6E87B
AGLVSGVWAQLGGQRVFPQKNGSDPIKPGAVEHGSTLQRHPRMAWIYRVDQGRHPPAAQNGVSTVLRQLLPLLLLALLQVQGAALQTAPNLRTSG